MRNSVIAIGDGSVSMPSSYDKMSKASTNGRIILIDVDQDGTDVNLLAIVLYHPVLLEEYTSVVWLVYMSSSCWTMEQKAQEKDTVQATVVDGGSPLFVGRNTQDRC